MESCMYSLYCQLKQNNGTDIKSLILKQNLLYMSTLVYTSYTCLPQYVIFSMLHESNVNEKNSSPMRYVSPPLLISRIKTLNIYESDDIAPYKLFTQRSG